jgi:hypothetical protein
MKMRLTRVVKGQATQNHGPDNKLRKIFLVINDGFRFADESSEDFYPQPPSGHSNSKKRPHQNSPSTKYESPRGGTHQKSIQDYNHNPSNQAQKPFADNFHHTHPSSANQRPKRAKKPQNQPETPNAINVGLIKYPLNENIALNYFLVAVELERMHKVQDIIQNNMDKVMRANVKLAKECNSLKEENQRLTNDGESLGKSNAELNQKLSSAREDMHQEFDNKARIQECGVKQVEAKLNLLKQGTSITQPNLKKY